MVIKGALLHYFDVLHRKYVQLTTTLLSPSHGITEFNGLKLTSLHPFVLENTALALSMFNVKKHNSRLKIHDEEAHV